MSRVIPDNTADSEEFLGVRGVLPLKKRVIPRTVRHLRQLLDMSQESLARRSNLNVYTVRSIETGLHDPRISTIERISAALMVQVAYIVGAELDLDSAISPGPIAADQIHAYFAGQRQVIHQSRRCRICAVNLPAGEPHGVGTCLLALYHAGKSREWLASTFDLRPGWVDAILDVEYGVNRRIEI